MACIPSPNMVRHGTCWHSYAVERGLVVGFCDHPLYCIWHYCLTARFQSPSSHVVYVQPFLCPCCANVYICGLAQSPSCDCGQWQTMNHIIDMCSLTKFEGRLNSSLRNFNTWYVLVGSRKLWRDFLGIGPNKIWGPKTPIFDDVFNPTQWQLWGPIPLARNTIETIGTQCCKLQGVPYIVSRFHELVVHEWQKISPSFLPTLQNFCIFLLCRTSHTQFGRQNSTKLCHMVGSEPQ